MTILLTQATVSTPEINEKLFSSKSFAHQITFQGLYPLHKMRNLCKYSLLLYNVKHQSR